jgi:hypothetical protein
VFVSRGFDVLMPFGGGQSYDLAVDLGGSHFLRIQCKTAWLVGREPARNNQRRNVRFAAEFEIDRWTEEKLRALSA